MTYTEQVARAYSLPLFPSLAHRTSPAVDADGSNGAPMARHS